MPQIINNKAYLEERDVNLVHVVNVDVSIRVRSAAVELEKRLLGFFPLIGPHFGPSAIVAGRVDVHHRVVIVGVVGFIVVADVEGALGSALRRVV